MSMGNGAFIGGFREMSAFSIRIPGDEAMVKALPKIAKTTVAT